jgi:hypothetical protein
MDRRTLPARTSEGSANSSWHSGLALAAVATLSVVFAGLGVAASSAGDLMETPPVTFGDEIATGVIGRPDAVAFSDVTGDGLGDVLVTTRWHHDAAYDRKLWVVPTTGSGSLAEPVLYPTHSADPLTENVPLGMASGDIDGDGDQDVVVAIGENGIDVFLQENGALQPATSQPMDSRPGQLVLYDMDVDGDLDLIMSGDTLAIAYNDGTGVFAPVRTVRSMKVFDFEVGEFTGDTTPDIAACQFKLEAPPVLVFGQEADGTFSTHGWGLTTELSHQCGGLAVADLTGDGADDVALTRPVNQTDSVVTVWQQQADHSLAPMPPQHVYDIPGTIEAADMNGDSLEDLVVVHNAWPALGVLRQTPTGDLQEETLQHGFSFVGAFWAKAMTTGDVTNDGLPDVITSNHSTAVVLPGGLATIETVADVALARRHITFGEAADVSYRVEPKGQAWPADSSGNRNVFRAVRTANEPWYVQATGRPVTESDTQQHFNPHFTTKLRLVYSGFGDYLPSEDTETLVVHPVITQQMLRPYARSGRYALYHDWQTPRTRSLVQPFSATDVRTVLQRRRADGGWRTIRARSIALVYSPSFSGGTASWKIGGLRQSRAYRVRTARPADVHNGRGISGWAYFRITR